MHRIYFITFFLFLCSKASVAKVVWEDNQTVRMLHPACPNHFFLVSSKINLNTASKEILLKLKGVGPKKAEAIIKYRRTNGPFKDLKDLSKIKGFTPKVVTKLMEENSDLLSIAEGL